MERNSKGQFIKGHHIGLGAKKILHHSGQFKIGHVSLTKGKHIDNGWVGRKHSPEAKEKMRLAKLGKKNPKLSAYKTGRKVSEETRVKLAKHLEQYHKGGADHLNWKGGVTEANYARMNKAGWLKTRLLVLERDGFTCQYPNCTAKGKNLDVHHIEPWRFVKIDDINNLITLCRKHHQKVERNEDFARKNGKKDYNLPFIPKNGMI